MADSGILFPLILGVTMQQKPFHDSWIKLLVIRLSALVRLHYYNRMMCEML